MASKTFTAPGQLPTRRNYCGPPSRHFPPPHGPPPGHHYGAPPYPPPTPHDSEPPSHFYSCPPPPHDFGCPPPPPPQHNPGYPPPSGHFQRQEAMWMTPEIRAELQIRNKLKMTDQQAYKAQCDKVQHMIDQSKASVGAGGYSVSPGQSSDPQLGNDPATLEAIATYYQNPSKYHSQVHTCGPCNRTYFSKRKLDEHLKEHVDCPFPECKMNAHTKVIDQHINNQHMLVNFANLQIDDKAWVTERKKRFPTAERAELRRAQQLEKVKRGEKLGRSTKPFPNKQGMSGKLQSTSGKFDRTNMGDRDRKRKDVSNTSDNKERKYSDRNRPQDNNKETKYSDRNRPHDNEAGRGDNKVTKDSESKPEERGRGGKFLKNRRKHLDRPPRAHLEVDMFDSDDDKDKPPPFQGTRHFYESTGEVNYFGNINADILDSEDEVSAQDDKNNLGISDDDEWQFERKDVTISSGALVLGGALGSLMGAYSDSEDEEPEQITVKDSNVKPATNASQQSNNLPTKPSQASNAGCPGVNKTNSKAASNENSSQSARPKQRRRPRAHKNNNNNKFVKPAPVRRLPRRRKTLLQKLLLPDIIHERNVILQCVRFIVKNNFFDDFVGEEEEGGVRKENGGREGGVREGDGGKEREEGVMEGHECKEGKKGVREGDGGKEGEKGGKEGDGGKKGEEGKEEGVRKGDRGKEGGVREGDEGKEEEKGVREGDGGKEGEEGVSKGYGGKEGIKKGEGVKEAGMEEGGIAEEGGEKESQEKAAVTPKETENEVLARNGTDSGNKRKRDEPVETEQKENCAGYQLPRNKERRVSDESKTDQTETGKGEVENSQSRGKDEEKRIGTENERRKEEGGNMEDRRNSTVAKNETRKGSDDMEVERTNDDIKELDQKMDEGGDGVKDKCMATKDEDERTTSDKELPSLENSVSKTNIASSDAKHGSDEECNITKESMAPNPSGDSKTVVASKNEGNTDSKTVVDSKHKESSDSNTVVDYNKENCDSNTVVDSNKESCDSNTVVDSNKENCDSNTVVDYNKENCNSKTVVDSKNEENSDSNTVVDSNKESSDSKTVVDYKNAENGDSKTVVDSKNKESSDSNIVVDINKENCDSNAVVDSKNNKKHVRLQVCVETSDSETVISSSDNSTECKPSLNTAMGENGLDNDSKTDVDFKALEKSSSDRVVDRSAIQRDSTESDNPSLHSAIAENGHSSTSTKRNATDLNDHCDDSTENKPNKIKKQRLPSSTENDDNTTVQ